MTIGCEPEPFDPRRFDEDAFLAGPERYASWDGEDDLVDVDPVFAKSFARIWAEHVAEDTESVVIAAEAHHTPAEAVLGYQFVEVSAGILLLDPTGQAVGGYLGCDLAIAPDHQGRGLGSELVLEYALRRERIPVWDHDVAAFSPAGEAAHRGAHRLAHRNGFLDQKRAALGLSPISPPDPKTDEIPPLPAALYHGTSDGYAEQILRDGLDPASSADGYLCYTDDIAIARYHAAHMADWDTGSLGKPCRPLVFRIPIDRFEITAFCLDGNFVRLGPSHGRAVGQNLAIRCWTWRRLLAHAGAVGYGTRLTVSAADLLDGHATEAQPNPAD